MKFKSRLPKKSLNIKKIKEYCGIFQPAAFVDPNASTQDPSAMEDETLEEEPQILAGKTMIVRGFTQDDTVTLTDFITNAGGQVGVCLWLRLGRWLLEFVPFQVLSIA